MSDQPVDEPERTGLDSNFQKEADDISDIRLIDAPVLVIFWVLLVIVLLQFFTRYVLNDSYAWTEEIARYFLILLGFVGSITCIRKGSHIFLEFFYRYLPDGAIKPLAILVELITAAFFTTAGFLCVQLAQRTHAQKMVSIDLPKAVIYWIVVVSCFAMALTAFYNVYKLYRERGDEIAREKIDQATHG